MASITLSIAREPRKSLSSLAYHMESKGYPLHTSTVFDYGTPGEIKVADDRFATPAELGVVFSDWVEPVTEWRQPLPPAVRTHTQHLRDYMSKDPMLITPAETIHVVKDIIRALHFLNDQIASD